MSENCSSDCGSCSSSCASRKPSREDFLEPANPNSHVKKVIGVVSGKGGVGKSLITSCLSVLLRRKGYQTAVLDADITGPSIPKAFGVHDKAMGDEQGILPAITKTGIKLMSVNLLLDSEEAPVVWRGPVISGTVKQFWSQVTWGDVDYMFVDMPPGTGDVPLTVFQSLPLDGIIIVTSPQELVSMIVAKAVNMARTMEIPVLGIIENYSYMQCANCGTRTSIFGESHVEDTAKKFGLEVLARIPIDPAIAQTIDRESVEEIQAEWLNEAVSFLEKKFSDQAHQIRRNCKIAVTVDSNNNIFGHFGKCERFAMYQIESNQVVKRDELSSNGSGHSQLVQLLLDNDVNVLICGGIGQGAMDMLTEAGISVFAGMQGDVEVNVASYLDGSLKESMQPNCDHHHEEEHECHGECNCH
ncbi:MAG TPA: P-loop NTPase [Lachnospiraceae bacterium]|nr:P-loop NTPase [Lachnospiraceae bacterium]